MKRYCIILLGLIFFENAHAQTYYQGLERMCWTDEKGKTHCYDAPRKWYHENTIRIEGDSIFMYKVPVQMVKGKKYYSASDGAYYYYYGVIRQVDTVKTAFLVSYNCDYCGVRINKDTTTGFKYPIPSYDTLAVKWNRNTLTLGKTLYKPVIAKADFSFPDKTVFYFDSNSISRIDPPGQYELISQGIKNFLQTKDLKLDNDTLRICLDRYNPYTEKRLIETLDSQRINIDTSGIIVRFYTSQELMKLVLNANKPIRVIKVRQIVEYWKAASISLVYQILLPESIHHFSEREYSNSFSYNKTGKGFELIDDIRENNWGLVEKK